jgi:hypothetical protein
MTLQSAVYILCFLTCGLCTGMLLRAWMRTQTRLLLWVAISLAFLALNNLLVIIDLMVFPGVDLQLLRSLAALAAGISLLAGLIWESE